MLKDWPGGAGLYGSRSCGRSRSCEGANSISRYFSSDFRFMILILNSITQGVELICFEE